MVRPFGRVSGNVERSAFPARRLGHRAIIPVRRGGQESRCPRLAGGGCFLRPVVSCQLAGLWWDDETGTVVTCWARCPCERIALHSPPFRVTLCVSLNGGPPGRPGGTWFGVVLVYSELCPAGCTSARSVALKRLTPTCHPGLEPGSHCPPLAAGETIGQIIAPSLREGNGIPASAGMTEEDGWYGSQPHYSIRSSQLSRVRPVSTLDESWRITTE